MTTRPVIFGIDKVGGYDPINLRATQRTFDAINNRSEQSSAAWTLRVEPGFGGTCWICLMSATW